MTIRTTPAILSRSLVIGGNNGQQGVFMGCFFKHATEVLEPKVIFSGY